MTREDLTFGRLLAMLDRAAVGNGRVIELREAADLIRREIGGSHCGVGAEEPVLTPEKDSDA